MAAASGSPVQLATERAGSASRPIEQLFGRYRHVPRVPREADHTKSVVLQRIYDPCWRAPTSSGSGSGAGTFDVRATVAASTSRCSLGEKWAPLSSSSRPLGASA